jgi:hypothetical protein
MTVKEQQARWPAASVSWVPPLILERVLRRTVRTDTGCVESLYTQGTSHGYAEIAWSDAGVRKHHLCHRVVWIATHGPIPAGMTVDHLCHNRRCVEVSHLRLLTNVENARDNGFKTRTHCPRGHEYTPDNTYTRTDKRGWTMRNCRECARIRRRARTLAKGAAS